MTLKILQLLMLLFAAWYRFIASSFPEKFMYV